MKENKTVLILYTELAGYTIACIKALAEDFNVHVVNWPVNKEAPFDFSSISNVSFYKRSDLNVSQLLSLSQSIAPDLIVCSGWVDKGYLKVCKAFKDRIPVILAIDNHWLPSLKNEIKAGFARLLFTKSFSHIWIPGKPQLSFAEKLGFKLDNIRTGFYSADVELFSAPPKTVINKNFLYVGRYIDFKGIKELWSAFIKVNSKSGDKWTLHCAGHGELWDEKTVHENIIHHGFLQPDELSLLIKKCDVFILPSHKEPWGVVVHEMAAAGLVLLCSDKIGAASEFLIDSENGYYFEAKNENSLVKAMKTVIEKTEAELLEMSLKSQKLSLKITPETWSNTLKSLLE